jgi:uncharacterized protein YcbK (DUF882 family)
MQEGPTRRKFLQQTLYLTAAGLVAFSPGLSLAATVRDTRSLRFYHTHTGERLRVTYARAGSYDRMALNEINHYLRDFRTEEQYPIDPRLLDVLWLAKRKLASRGVYEVISGYRSPKTNAYLRQHSNGVAKKSLHMKGRAIDVRLTGTETQSLQHCAIGMRIGGVGFYAKSDFVHLDTGRVRSW